MEKSKPASVGDIIIFRAEKVALYANHVLLSHKDILDLRSCLAVVVRGKNKKYEKWLLVFAMGPGGCGYSGWVCTNIDEYEVVIRK